MILRRLLEDPFPQLFIVNPELESKVDSSFQIVASAFYKHISSLFDFADFDQQISLLFESSTFAAFLSGVKLIVVAGLLQKSHQVLRLILQVQGDLVCVIPSRQKFLGHEKIVQESVQ